MRHHYDEGLNVKDLLNTYKPKCVLELGAETGRNTVKLMESAKELGFKLVVISDEPLKFKSDKIEFIQGVSYREIPNLTDVVDFAIIDTDHNYWTMAKELEALKGCKIITAHDTLTYGFTDGIQHGGYRDGSHDYPEDEINKTEKKGVKSAILDFLAENREYSLIRESEDSNGAMAIGVI